MIFIQLVATNFHDLDQSSKLNVVKPSATAGTQGHSLPISAIDTVTGESCQVRSMSPIDPLSRQYFCNY